VSFSDSQFLDNLLYIYGNETFLYIKFSVGGVGGIEHAPRARLLALVLYMSAECRNEQYLQFNQAVAFINSHGSLCAIPSAKCAVSS